jgi:hypothetical protein
MCSGAPAINSRKNYFSVKEAPFESKEEAL